MTPSIKHDFIRSLIYEYEGSVRIFAAFTEKTEFLNIVSIIKCLDRFTSISLEKTAGISFESWFLEKAPLKLGLADENVRDRNSQKIYNLLVVYESYLLRLF